MTITTSLLLVRQFKATGRLWPVLKCMPPEAPKKSSGMLQSGYHPRIILYDLPGTVNAEGVIRLLASLDAVFVPMKADKVVMESTLSLPGVSPLTLPKIRPLLYKASIFSGR